MLMTTSDAVPGREIAETLGLVSANAVRARHVGRDILAGLKNLGAGRSAPTGSCSGSPERRRWNACRRRRRRWARTRWVALRISTSSVAQGASEILAYGTAVKLR